MDPNANLKEQAELIADGLPDAMSDRRRLSELRRALFDWITGGGFEPDWRAYPAASKAYRVWLRQSRKFQDLWR